MRLFAFEHHHNQEPWAGAPPWAIELREMLAVITNREETIMSAKDDLNNAVTALTTGFNALDTTIQPELAAIVAAAGGNAVIEQAVANIAAVTTGMAKDAAALTA